MSRTDTTARPDEINSVEELHEVEIRPEDVAVDLKSDEWYFVLETPDVPAGAYQLDGGLGTVAEWYDCDDDADVVVGVSFGEASEKPDEFDDIDAVRAAVEHGRLFSRAVPESQVVPALEEFLEARKRGEWDGLANYIRRSSGVSA